MKYCRGLAAAAILPLSALCVCADVRVNSLFSDNMVLQRGRRVPVWGWAAPGESVAVKIGTQVAIAAADDGGAWMAWLEPLPEGGPYVMEISGKNKIVIRNVLVGEVWVGSGQSNMHWPVSKALEPEREIASAAAYPKIREFRLFASASGADGSAAEDVRGSWTAASPQSVGNFSAVGYFFCREVQQALETPMGFIHIAEGTTPVTSWISMETAESEPELHSLKAIYERETVKTPLNDRAVPGYWYNRCVAPVIPYGIRGVLWYQGESGGGHGLAYHVVFTAMIRGWRKAWGDPDMPFLFVQLPNYFKHEGTEDGLQTLPVERDGEWILTREGQLLASRSVPYTGMAITIDVGDPRDVHPRNKQAVGHRLALLALVMVYGRKDSLCSGPVYKRMQTEGSRVRLFFDYAAGGLAVRPPGRAAAKPLKTAEEMENAELDAIFEKIDADLEACGSKPGADAASGDGRQSAEPEAGETQSAAVAPMPDNPVKGFAIAGADGRFVWADARIEGETVVVWSDAVANPRAVRYAWAMNPIGNLCNAAGLPASPFRTDPPQ